MTPPSHARVRKHRRHTRDETPKITDARNVALIMWHGWDFKVNHGPYSEFEGPPSCPNPDGLSVDALWIRHTLDVEEWVVQRMTDDDPNGRL